MDSAGGRHCREKQDGWLFTLTFSPRFFFFNSGGSPKKPLKWLLQDGYIGVPIRGVVAGADTPRSAHLHKATAICARFCNHHGNLSTRAGLVVDTTGIDGETPGWAPPSLPNCGCGEGQPSEGARMKDIRTPGPSTSKQQNQHLPKRSSRQQKKRKRNDIYAPRMHEYLWRHWLSGCQRTGLVA